MATDFLHDRAIMEALKNVLVANLPATWLDTDNPYFGLKTLKAGRLRDYDLSDEETWRNLCPAILIRSNRTSIQGFALGGPKQTDNPMRVVHLWHRSCNVDTGGNSIEAILAQADRAKVLTPCLLKTLAGAADLSLTAATLTTTDTSAEVLKGSSEVTSVSFEGEGVEFPGGDYLSVVIDYNVQTVTE